MQPASRSEELGQVVSQHLVDRSRRFTVGVAGVSLGAVFLLCYGVLPDPVDAHGNYSPGAARVQGVILGLAVVGFLIAARYLWKAVRGGRGEYFEVREHGLVHGNARRVEVWRWSDIEGVREIDLPDSPIRRLLGAIYRLLGANYLCRVLLRNGRRFSVNGLTGNYEELGDALVANCPFLPDSTGPRWLWSTSTVVSIVGFLFCLVYLLSHPGTDERVKLADSMYQTVHTPGLSDGTALLLILGLVVTFIFGTTSVIMLIRARNLVRQP